MKLSLCCGSRPVRGKRRLPAILCILIVSVVLTTSLASARILHTRYTPFERWDPLLPLTIGSAIELETDNNQLRLDFPVFLEYNFTQALKLTIEPNVTHIESRTKDVRTVTGVADLETSLQYEFLRERRYRPALTVEGGIKWPTTATDPDTGRPGTDFLIGLIASKDLVFVDVDLTALYSFVGDSQEPDTFEIATAADWHLNHLFDVEAEIVHSFGTGPTLGRPGSISGIGASSREPDLTEGTLGVAWHITKRFKIEQGAILRSDGTWQVVFAWEWSFSGD